MLLCQMMPRDNKNALLLLLLPFQKKARSKNGQKRISIYNLSCMKQRVKAMMLDTHRDALLLSTIMRTYVYIYIYIFYTM